MIQYKIMKSEDIVKTVKIELNIEQLNIIKNALKSDTSSNDEKNILIDMITETIDDPNSDIIYGYCY